MTERPTTKITTPSGKDVEIKTYLTARERNALREIYLAQLKIPTAAGSAPDLGQLSGDILEHAERKLIELAVVRYDGSAENILDRLLDGTPEEYDFVVAEANKIGSFKPAK